MVMNFASDYPLLGSVTDGDGRCSTLLPSSPRLEAGIYKMTFNTGEYFTASNRDTFYPVVEVRDCISAFAFYVQSFTTPQITFHLAKPEEHYHIPLLLSPWSYTTYRGS